MTYVGERSDDLGPCIWAVRDHVHIINPTCDEIHLDVIAVALSRIPRFNGLTRADRPPISVAQHCVLCAEIAAAHGDDWPTQRLALMHDATEAYIGDLARPWKQLLPDFSALEARLWKVVARRFLLIDGSARMAEIDNMALSAEKEKYCPGSGRWRDLPTALKWRSLQRTWSSRYAAARFLRAASDLGIKEIDPHVV